MSVLVRAEDVARSANFKVAQGDFEARAELCEVTDGGKALLRHVGDGFSAGEREVGEGAPVGAPYPAPELIELRQAEAVGVFDDEGVAVRHVNAAFYDGGAHEQVGFLLDKTAPDFGKLLLTHFAVGEGDARVRQIALKHGGAGGDAFDVVVQIEHLTAAAKLLFDGF